MNDPQGGKYDDPAHHFKPPGKESARWTAAFERHEGGGRGRNAPESRNQRDSTPRLRFRGEGVEDGGGGAVGGAVVAELDDDGG